MPADIDLETLRRLLQRGQLEPYIQHIRFPKYKNLSPGTRLDLTFPITALVGANGTNKSSVLRALFGCPENNNLGSIWFSTKIDPIEETGSIRNCFIYGYKNEATNQTVEVIKTRIRKEDDPDYWEPSRPLRVHGMDRMPALVSGAPIPAGRTQTRWNPIRKNVVYLDFRSTLSAFDKFFYHGDLRSKPNTEKNKKDLIRRRAPHLKTCINDGLLSYTYHDLERIIDRTNFSLTDREREEIGNILGKEYSDIRLIRHRFFNCDAFTCMLKTSHLDYTEAFAGSGEFAICRIVAELLRAPDKSLILLDEPEVSLHPGAQERLIAFLAKTARTKKHQIVLATHSPTIVNLLPSEAIKVFISDPTSGQVKIPKQSSLSSEAFFYLGASTNGKLTVVVEDVLAGAIVKRALSSLGEAIASRFEVRHYPGGSQTLWKHYLPIFAAEQRSDVLVLLDGDKEPDIEFPLSASIPEQSRDEILKQNILTITGVDIEFHRDGGATGGDDEQEANLRKQFVDWARNNVKYLPRKGDSPEEFIWGAMESDALSDEVDNAIDAKRKFVELTRKEFGLMEFEPINSADIFSTQRKRLATISIDLPELTTLKDLLLAFAET